MHVPKLQQLLVLGHAFHVIGDMGHSDISVALPLRPRRRVEYSNRGAARFKYDEYPGVAHGGSESFGIHSAVLPRSVVAQLGSCSICWRWRPF